MPAIGPRVGGAHVDVNLQFDDKSLKTVGKRVHKQLSRLNDSLVKVGERNREVYRSIGRDAVTAWRAALGLMVASAPLMGSLISGVAGAATLLAGSLYSVVQSSYGFAPLLAAIGVAAGTAAIGMNGFIKAVKSGDMEGLTPSARAAAEAVRGLSGAWGKLRDAVQERMFKGLADDIERLGSTLFPTLQRGLGKMAGVLNGLAQEMLNYVNSAAGLRTIERFLNNSADIFGRLSGAVVPFLDGFLRLMNALAPAGKRLADRITDISKRFQGWTKGAGFAERIDTMMKRAEKTAGLLFKVLGNLGAAIRNVFDAANPATNVFLQMLVDLTKRFKDWTSSVEGQNSIAKWAEQSVDVMRQFGKTLEAVFTVLGELANPRVIISFLRTVEEAFNYLGKLPLEKLVTGFVNIAEALQPVSSLFLAFIIAGAAANILIGSLIGQLGGLFTVINSLLKFKILTTILRNIGGGAGEAGGKAAKAAAKTGLLSRAWAFLLKIVGKARVAFRALVDVFTGTSRATGTVATKAGALSKAFKPVLSILGRFAKFAGWVGVAVWIGTIIARSEKLQRKLKDVWEAARKVGSALSGAFKEIQDAIAPLVPAADKVGSAFGKVFGWLDKLMGLAIGGFLDMVVLGFESLASVISGAGSIIAGLITVLSGLFTLDFGKMWQGLKQMVSGIGPLLSGLFGLFATIFAPARLLKVGAGAMRGLASGFKSSMPGIMTAVGQFALGLYRSFTSLPGRLLTIGGRAISFLWKAISSRAPKVIAAAGRIFNGVVGWITRLPGRLHTLGTQAISRLSSAVSRGVGALRSIAGRILTATVNGIRGLPGRLLTIGRNAISQLSSALRTGIGKARGIISSIKSAILGALSGLPGQMLGIGRNIVGNLISGLTEKLNSVRNIAGKIAGAIKGVFPGSPVEYGPLTAWNRGGDASGGGRNVIDAIAAGLKDTSPIESAMSGIAGAMASSIGVTRGRNTSTGRAPVSSVSHHVSNIEVNIDVDDLEKMSKVSDFLEMLDRARVTSRQTLRSGTVTA